MSNEFTPAEVAQLQELYGEDFVTTTPNGQVIATVTRREFLNLADRYPSMLGDQPRPAMTGDPQDDLLRARYPTMYLPPKS